MSSVLAAGTLIVRIIGLATVTDAVPNDCGVHVIVPRVEYSAGSHAQHGTSKHVEDHTAFLVVHKDNYDDAKSTWKLKTLPAYKDYRYVELDGDEIRVITDAANDPPSLQNLKLPSLKGCCTKPGTPNTLKEAYQAPYTGAAAVLDVHGGIITGCSVPATGAQSRYDTEIAMKHRGAVKISGDTMKVRKEIRLKGLPIIGAKQSVVYIANLPTCFLTNTCKPKPATAADSAPHSDVYMAMMSNSAACKKSLLQCLPPKPANCQSPMIHNKGKSQALSFECSNTKWP